MPLIRLTGWPGKLRSGNLPPSLSAFLVHDARMELAEAEATVQRLKKGKSVDITFDTGEDESATAFAEKAKTFSLDAEIYMETSHSWTGSPPSPRFLKLSAVVLVGFGICVWLFASLPSTIIAKMGAAVELVLVVFWVFSASGGILDKRPRTEEEKERDWNQGFWLKLWVMGAVVLLATFINEPVYGVILLVTILGGAGCALFIRWMNRD
jgi:hypothetical protein